MEAFAGRYRLIDLVGTGGMGSVWRAWDLRRHGYVAAKVLGQHDAATLLRFVREQSLRIDHPHVVAPHGWAADDDKVVFAMDLVRGGSVATLLGDHGPLPASYVAVLVDQLLHGLSAVHAAGIVHRDLKPANLLLDATGTATPRLRLSDFGIAGLLDEPRMTRHSTVLGTPGYIAPEQLAGADPDPRQDLYTVGAVAAELLTGDRPSIYGSLPAGESDDALWDLIRLLTEKDPAARPESAAAAGRLLAKTDLIPRPGVTPWTDQSDPPEVFDQLPPLPAGWEPNGPAVRPSTGPAGPTASAPAASTSTGSAGPTASAPAASTSTGPVGPTASTPAASTSSTPAASTAAGSAVPPSTGSAARTLTGSGAAAASPVGLAASASITSAAPGSSAASVTPGSSAASVAPGSRAASVAPGSRAASVVPGLSPASAAPGSSAAPAGPTFVAEPARAQRVGQPRRGGLFWLAVASFGGAAALLASALYLLLR
ncbi:protein kinase [Kribbella sp. NPDC056861]|uniref:protein kinase domain-containing protein n=1 Tax=Kribbella sp. NPDC056861 TaxID=3154857 RepID=UPI003438A19A